MADFTVSRLGQINEAGDAWALFLKKFGGEVLTSYEDENITQGKVLERNIDSGKSAQFPATGKVGSGYHTPGQEITGQAVAHAEVIITVDGVLYSDVFVDNLDEMMNHYESRSIYTEEMGAELARQYDENNLRCILLAARSGAIVNGGNGGTILENVNYGTDGAALKDGVWKAAQALDEKNAPSKRWAGFRPAQYYLLANQTDLLNQDWGGRGDYSKAQVPEIAGVNILKCNHIPQQDDSANADLMAKYQANFLNTRGVVWTNRAAGVVKLAGLVSEGESTVRHQGTLLVAKYAVGHGKLRSDNAVELTVDDGVV